MGSALMPLRKGDPVCPHLYRGPDANPEGCKWELLG